MCSNNEKRNALSAQNVGHTFEVLAAAAGIASLCIPGAATVTSIATTGRMIASVCERHQNARQSRRAARLIESLTTRLRAVEATQATEEEVDLFQELYLNAIRDEDEEKTEFHSCLIAWFTKQKPPPAQVRRLCEAIRGLTTDELRAFVHWGNSRGGNPFLFGEIDEIPFWSRLQHYGLFKGAGSVTHPNNITRIGRVLVDEFKEFVYDSNTQPPRRR